MIHSIDIQILEVIETFIKERQGNWRGAVCQQGVGL
jgi:hypothetical protein